MGSLMEKELRKRQILLFESGVGVILFAFWNIIKINLYYALIPFPVEAIYEEAAKNGISAKFLIISIIVIALGFLLWQLSIRVYVGMSARAEGKGKKKGYAYLVWAVILLMLDFSINWQAFDVKNLLAGGEIGEGQITNICLEAASAYVLLQLLISGIRVKRLRKKMKV